MGKFAMLSLLSGTITMVLSLFWIIVSGLSLTYRRDCYSSDSLSKFGSDYMWMLFYKQYVLDERCVGTAFVSQLTSTRTVHIFTIVSMTFAVTSLISSILLLISTNVKSCNKFVEVATFFHVTSYVSGFIVDAAFATQLGVDYAGMTETMNMAISGFSVNYGIDALRIAILMVSLLVMKGVVAPLINMGIIGLMLMYLTEYVQAQSEQEISHEHSIHSRGVLNAYDWQHTINECSPETSTQCIMFKTCSKCLETQEHPLSPARSCQDRPVVYLEILRLSPPRTRSAPRLGPHSPNSSAQSRALAVDPEAPSPAQSCPALHSACMKSNLTAPQNWKSPQPAQQLRNPDDDFHPRSPTGCAKSIPPAQLEPDHLFWQGNQSHLSLTAM